MSDQEVCDLVFQYRSNMRQAAARLVEEASMRWQLEEDVIDDITTVILTFKDLNPDLQNPDLQHR